MRFLEFLCGEHPQSAHAGYARLCPRGVSGVSCGRLCHVDRRYPAMSVSAWIEAVKRELAMPSVKQRLVAIVKKKPTGTVFVCTWVNSVAAQPCHRPSIVRMTESTPFLPSLRSCHRSSLSVNGPGSCLLQLFRCIPTI
jgi:hypothetical protein